METNISPRRRTPLYRQKRFWTVVIALGLVAAGVASYYLTKRADFSITNPVADHKDQGRLEIYTAPKGATIIIDGKPRREKSDAKFSLPLGKHTVTLKLSGYDTATIPITVVRTNAATIQQTFTKQGKITVTQPVSEFKTYTNDTYKYRIRYPSSWEAKAGSPEVVNFYNRDRAQGPQARSAATGLAALPAILVPTARAHGEDQTSLAILTQPNPGNLSPSEWYKARPEYAQEDQSQIKTRELTVNGQPAFQYETPYGFAPYLNTVVTGHGQAFILQQIQGSPERATYDTVIQTFALF